MIFNLPVDLLEEILSRVLLKSIGAVRSTCKNWNVLSKDERFANKHIEKTAASQRDKEVLVITVNTKDDLISVKFYDFHKKNFDPSINRNGNTYWIAKDDSEDVYLLCFDFTRERFGPRLPLPFSFAYGGYVSLSSVKEERLAMLLKQPGRIFEITDVWVTDKIEPGAVSWSKLFKVETLKLNCRSLFGIFLIDEEKKNFVVFDNCEGSFKTYIIDGESGHFREVESIEAPYSRLDNLVDCYVPSSVQI
uniref:F-box domain-containing protein n=1 Tax=Brassica campestris TaxID=3711 RepID=M4E108_BRACM